MLDLFILVQSKMIGMWMINFRTKRFSHFTKDNTFQAANASKNALFPLFFCGGYSIIWPIIVIQTILDPGRRSGIIQILPVIIIMGILSLFSLRQFLWLVRGVEHLKIDGENLTITKTGSFWIKPTVYSLALITDVRTKQQDWDRKGHSALVSENIRLTTELKNMFYKFSVGEIRFRYKNEQVRLFSNLSEHERDLVIDKIKMTEI